MEICVIATDGCGQLVLDVPSGIGFALFQRVTIL